MRVKVDVRGSRSMFRHFIATFRQFRYIQRSGGPWNGSQKHVVGVWVCTWINVEIEVDVQGAEVRRAEV